MQAYLAAISLADHAVGLVVDGLLKGPNASNTIVCLWSDHGWQLGEKLAWRKFTLWERATRVPLMIGGNDLRSGRSTALISTIDLYPTLARLGVGEAPKGLDGVSFVDYLRGTGGPPRDHVISTWTLDAGEGDGPYPRRHVAVRTRDHRFIAYGNGDRELYDHRDDPWEWRNLYDKPSREEIALADRLAAFVPKTFASTAPSSSSEDRD